MFGVAVTALIGAARGAAKLVGLAGGAAKVAKTAKIAGEAAKAAEAVAKADADNRAGGAILDWAITGHRADTATDNRVPPQGGSGTAPAKSRRHRFLDRSRDNPEGS